MCSIVKRHAIDNNAVRRVGRCGPSSLLGNRGRIGSGRVAVAVWDIGGFALCEMRDSLTVEVIVDGIGVLPASESPVVRGC